MRLKHDLTRSGRLGRPQFLFQIGAIKTYPSIADASIYDRRFYSRLVRLKLNKPTIPTLRTAGFYSRLVRLKPSIFFDCCDFFLGFLFQIGAIKTGGCGGVGCGVGCVFLFQIGAIKTLCCY